MRALATFRGLLLVALSLFALGFAAPAAAQSLVLNNVGTPTQVGTGAGKRAIWTNAGTVGGTTIDLVAVLTTATLNHNFTTTNSRASITSVGQDNVFIDWRLYQAGTYDINTDTGGVPVIADVHVQINDVDGPNNERVFVPVCSGDVDWIRIDKSATTGRDFGTVAGQAETFSLIGDQNYASEPESGLEIRYSNTSTFTFGRTANNNFFIRVDSPTYSSFDTFDYQCADFVAPAASDDSEIGTPDTATSVSILLNDAIATANDNGPNNNSLTPSEFGLQTVSLTAPVGATGIVTDADGDVTGFSVPGEGSWAQNDTTGILTFTPLDSFDGSPTPITYTYRNDLGQVSNAATVTITYPGIGVVKNSTFNDDITADTNGQVGETITYSYTVTNLSALPLNTITLTETGFTGAGTTPVPTYVSGDANGNSILEQSETWTYTATYTLVAADVSGGGTQTVSNQATAGGQTEGGIPVTDLSDSGNAGDGDGTGTPGTGTGNDDVTVTSFGTAPIDAINDAPTSINGKDGGTTTSALGNDTLNSGAVSLATITLTPGAAPSPTAGTITMNADGTVTVTAGTTAGSYTYPYTICETLNPSNCDTATATIAVSAAPIDAINDALPTVDGTAGETTASVMGNDTLNGVAVVPADVTLTPGAAPLPSITMATDGTITIAPGTAPGSYTYPYTICENLNPANCDTANATVVVATPGMGVVKTSVFNDDSTADTNGQVGETITYTYTVTNLSALPLNTITLTETGFTGAGTTPVPAYVSGDTNANSILEQSETWTYTATYTLVAADVAGGNVSNQATGAGQTAGGTPVTDLSDSGNPGDGDGTGTPGPGPNNGDTTLISFGTAPIDAVNDTPGAINGTNGGSTTSVLGNDTLNGAGVSLAAVDLTPGTAPSPTAGAITMNADGTVTVSAGTTAGSYPFNYTICETLNPANCDTATTTIIVGAAPLDAVDVTPTSVNGSLGGTMPSVLSNDTLNGAAVTLADVNFTPGAAPTPTAGSITMNPDGTITIAPGTTAGSYTYSYQICEKLNPTNCDTATVTVVVDTAPIDAVDDTPPAINGFVGGTSPSILANDTLSTLAVNAADITLTPGAIPTPTVGTLTMNGDGTVTVGAGTTAGTYTIPYQICENLNPANCDTATLTLVVDPPVIVAVADTPPSVNGTNGGTMPSVLTNDTLNGAAVNPANITLTPGTPPSPTVGSITMNPDGTITIAAGTTAGSYPFSYTICDVVNPANCSTTTVTIVVDAAPIDAIDDTPPALSGNTGGTTASVLANDTFNAAALVPANVTLTAGTAPTTAIGSITMNPDGTITVAPITSPGTYAYPYTICENLNPTNCDTATATVELTGHNIADILKDDSSRNNILGAPVTLRVLANDAAPTGIFDPATLRIIGTAAPGDPLVVSGQGTWIPDLQKGTITFAPVSGFAGNPTPVRYTAIDIFGVQLTPATVTIEYDVVAAFVCSDIIGKVFDDANGNGRQDEGEAGIPGARIATVKGLIITTDQFGRYHVPCAEVAKETGTNFLLKVMPDSLPTGYRFTTENPRVTRLSKGMMARVNFGVSLSNVVEIALNASAFDPATNRITAEVEQAIDALITQIADTPTVIDLSYQAGAEPRGLVTDRLNAFEEAIQARWRGRGRYRLTVEKNLVRKN
ncbi:beta strand repeat-containing protein [Pseudooceanicola sp. MF1-13]|uniref:beta strand repeat-containing protein n=1 Tax=Pseudooceanicola sp. MF1-13 TaxID=3379095 RepID=UPI0038922018